MYFTHPLLLACALNLIAFTQAALSGYAPVAATCPKSPLVRTASGLSAPETAYIAARSPIASAALGKWLQMVNLTFSTANLPKVALTTSGGGLRSLLIGAGVIQAFDARDSNTGVSGLYQGLTYQAGLSGGGWLLSSVAGNNYPTISSLQTNLWTTAFQDGLLDPANLAVGPAYAQITADVEAKNAAGFSPTIVDVYGRLLSYQLLYGTDGGVAIELSSITGFSNFTSHAVPYPIITALDIENATGACTPPNNSVIYEFSPYEFGSFDSGINAFTQTRYLGTSLSNGVPTKPTCETNYDNLGYILGTSSDIFNEFCASSPTSAQGLGTISANITSIITNIHALTPRDEYAIYPNPFYNYTHSTLVSAKPILTLADGGESHQNNPLFPLLQSSRKVGVIIVNDNSADTSGNFPNGSQLHQTYLQSLSARLTRMPVIPPTITNAHPIFFGCNDTSKITIVYLPNYNYTFPSGESTFKPEYSAAETSGMIMNGGQVATDGGNKTFPLCLACAVVKKTGGVLPAGCAACFATFCYN